MPQGRVLALSAEAGADMRGVTAGPRRLRPARGADRRPVAGDAASPCAALPGVTCS